jgi:hypothetical protein
VGATNNYQCVDESYDVPDEDTSYVWMMNPSTVTDMYTLQNHTTETGTINYVRIYARCKSNLYPQSATGLYRILANHSSVTSRSADNNLTTDYNTYSYLLTSTPSGAAWNWTAIDNLKIGWDASSPAITGYPASMTIRPNAAGSSTELTPAPAVANYLNVDDVIADDHTTDNFTFSTSVVTDTYAMTNHTTESGVITGITVQCRIMKTGNSSTDGFFAPAIKTIGSPIRNPAYRYIPYNYWGEYTTTWASNPTTSVAWTWTEVDNVECGISFYLQYANAAAICTQIYAVVNYIGYLYPHIHTTQMYARVNYTPSSASCYLNRPTRYGISNTRKLSIIQPEHGDRVVYDLCRESKTLSMEGLEYDTATSTATSRLLCVRNMKDNGEYITISGISDDKIDTTWLMTDFSFNRDETNPQMWNWNLTAEKYEGG